MPVDRPHDVCRLPPAPGQDVRFRNSLLVAEGCEEVPAVMEPVRREPVLAQKVPVRARDPVRRVVRELPFLPDLFRQRVGELDIPV